VIGNLPSKTASSVATQLRLLKVDKDEFRVPASLEIALVLPSARGQFPGLYVSPP